MFYQEEIRWEGNAKSCTGVCSQSIPTSLSPSRAPGALVQAQMLCQDKAPVFNSSCASKIPDVHLSFTKSPSFLKRLKLHFQKPYFLVVSLLLSPTSLQIFLSPSSPHSSTTPCCHPSLHSTHMERLLSVIQALGASFYFIRNE